MILRVRQGAAYTGVVVFRGASLSGKGMTCGDPPDSGLVGRLAVFERGRR